MNNATLITLVLCGLLIFTLLVCAAIDPPAPRPWPIVTEETDDHKSNLCMPCVGPHYDFSKGKFSFFGMGPGLHF